MKKIFSNILFVVGICIILIPFILRCIAYFNQTKVVTNYRENINSKSENEIKEEEGKIKEYNNKLLDGNQIININENIENTSTSSFDFLDNADVIGTLVIPSINIDLPIYDGVSEEKLQKGVSHLEDTSYPTGDINTHSVLAGHSGLTNAKILDDLDKLKIGDIFKIEYLNNETSYKVIDIKVVLPDETDSLKIRENESLVTLVTCTPKSINTHRLLVTGRKVETSNEDIKTDSKLIIFLKQNYIFILVIVLIMIVILINKVCEKKNKEKIVKKGRF